MMMWSHRSCLSSRSNHKNRTSVIALPCPAYCHRKDRLLPLSIMPTTRRRQQQQQQQQQQQKEEETNQVVVKEEDNDDDDASDQEENAQVYLLDGVEYLTYQEMVNAKRKRNQEVLLGLGFLDSTTFKMQQQQQQAARKMASARGIKKQKTDTKPVLRSRKSSRLTGKKTNLIALDYNVNDWTSNTTSVIKVEEGVDGKDGDDESIPPEIPTNFKGRVNDGSDLTLEEAISLNDPKWIKEDTVESSTHFQAELLANN
jgi:hypothetical protein